MNAATDMLKNYQVLIGVLVTEKSTFLRTEPLNKFTFRVPVAATKTQIRTAVQDAFGVKVLVAVKKPARVCAGHVAVEGTEANVNLVVAVVNHAR